MAQGDFTKEEIDEVSISLNEIFNALPRHKQLHLLGHLNDVQLFLSTAKKLAPSQSPKDTP